MRRDNETSRRFWTSVAIASAILGVLIIAQCAVSVSP
jgi:hypothetical protein